MMGQNTVLISPVLVVIGQAAAAELHEQGTTAWSVDMI